MAASAIVASGTTQANSSDFTLAAGTPATLSLFTASGVFANDMAATVFKKDSGGVYRALKGGDLTAMRPELVLDGPGEFRVTKYASVVACGVDRD
jgi:hypothetical protein